MKAATAEEPAAVGFRPGSLPALLERAVAGKGPSHCRRPRHPISLPDHAPTIFIATVPYDAAIDEFYPVAA